MTFEEYQKESRKTAIYPPVLLQTPGGISLIPWVYCAIGLSGEVGELNEKLKKVLRDKEGRISEECKSLIEKELGDIEWYVSQIATELGISLEDVARKNLEKLDSRQKRGKISGEGDNR